MMGPATSRNTDIAILLGGPTFPDVLDETVARALITDVLSLAQSQNRRALLVTSPRTPPKVGRAAQEMIKPPHLLYGFEPGAGNAYEQVLQQAASFVVTSDSVSMVADALGTGRPVSVYRLPQKSSFKLKLVEMLHHSAIRPVRWLYDKGFIESPADRRFLFEKLRREKRLVWFGESEITPAPGPDDLFQAVTRVRGLLSQL
jgi:mitochondrial fission protein ELM1